MAITELEPAVRLRAAEPAGLALVDVRPAEAEVDVMKAMVLLSSDGTVLRAKGEGAEDFAAVTAYATQLARLIGEDLGLYGFQEMDCEFQKGRCLVYYDSDGHLVGVRPRPETPLARVREVLGFP